MLLFSSGEDVSVLLTSNKIKHDRIENFILKTILLDTSYVNVLPVVHNY